MSIPIQTPTDPNFINWLLSVLVKEKPVNMGAAKEKMYGLTKDDMGNLRLPFSFARQTWNFQTPNYNQLPRRAISCNIVLGHDGKDYQIPTYKMLVQTVVEQRCAYLSLMCGGGKTMLATKLFAEMGLVTAVLTDATTIFPQWVKVLKETTNARICEVKTPVDVLPDADIYVMMVGACKKMHPRALEPIKLLLVDEAAYFATHTRIPAMLNFTPAYVVGLCAEIKRTDGMHYFLPLFFGPKVIRRISDKPFTVYRVETTFKPVVQTTRYKGSLDWNMVLDSIANNEERNKKIVELCRSLPDSKIIIGTKRKDQARYLYNALIEAKESAALLIESMKSFPQCRVLVGIYSKMGKGVDVKNLCEDWEGEVFDVAIIAADLCNPEQFVGRVFRHANPIVYHLVDDFSTLRKHFEKDCEPWYASRCGTIVRTILQ